MSYFWLQDEDSNTLDIDTTVTNLTIGGNKRNYNVVEFAGAPGGSIRGFGNPGSKKIVLSRKEKGESGDATAWNSRRNDYLSFFTNARWKDVYLYIRDGENSFTVKTQVYCTNIGADKYSYFRLSELRDVELISPKGLYENITSVTGSTAITSSAVQEVALTNDGMWETPIILKFTPTGNEDKFQVQLADNYGVQLQGTFTAASQVVYDTSDNSMTVGGVSVNPAQYVSAGSVFLVPPGSFSLFVTCSGAGSFAYEYSERYS